LIRSAAHSLENIAPMLVRITSGEPNEEGSHEEAT
jgi:hypothetical protein